MLNQFLGVFLCIVQLCQPNSTEYREAPIQPVFDAKEVHCLAEAIYHEARGEPFAGKEAVAIVVLNRKAHPEFPDTICKVVHEKGQFQWVGRQKTPKLNQQYIESVVIANAAMEKYSMGEAFGPIAVKRATHFSVGGFKYPRLRFSGKVGNHKFYEVRQ